MPTFNAAAARTVADKALNTESNSFALELEDRFATMTLTQRQALMRKLRDVVADEATAAAFAAGTYAQDNSGQPAKALGTGSPSIDEKEAWKVIMASGMYSKGQKNAAARIFAPSGDANRFEVETDGTPTEIKGQNKTITDLTTERDTFRKQLDDTKDPKVAGSLAQQLEAAKAKTAPANLVDKTVLVPKIAELRKKVEALSDGIHRPGTPSKKAEALAAVDDLVK